MYCNLRELSVLLTSSWPLAREEVGSEGKSGTPLPVRPAQDNSLYSGCEKEVFAPPPKPPKAFQIPPQHNNPINSQVTARAHQSLL